MKFVKALLVLVVLGCFFTSSSCKQKTCPTYSQANTASENPKV